MVYMPSRRGEYGIIKIYYANKNHSMTCTLTLKETLEVTKTGILKALVQYAMKRISIHKD